MYIIHYSILCHSPSIRKGRNSERSKKIRSSYPQVQSLGVFPCFSPEVLGWMWFSMILNGAVLSLVIAPREDSLSLVSRWVAGGDGNENYPLAMTNIAIENHHF